MKAIREEPAIGLIYTDIIRRWRNYGNEKKILYGP